MKDPRESRTSASTVMVIGGSSGLGRALAERLARAGHSLVLVSSDLRDTQALAADLALRWGVQAVPMALDLAQSPLPLAALDAALAAMPPLTGLLLAAGMNREGDEPGQAPASFAALTCANYTSLCHLVDHFLPRLRREPRSWIVGFGSVAATRGRTRNAAYSAAKRALQSYFESLRHFLAGSGVKVQFYVLGYLDTNLAFGQRTLLPRASPQRLADAVYRRKDSDFGVSYYPRFWYPVCVLLRQLPWTVFRRLSF
ncbi:MAG: SDR family oxidoreductase [Betaproteobacteria bacterium]|nr:SDR family oxidoreductase [Betaproteobacteria bacterium]